MIVLGFVGLLKLTALKKNNISVMSWRSVLLVEKTNKTDRHDITEILF
jgi:hypothetical protein